MGWVNDWEPHRTGAEAVPVPNHGVTPVFKGFGPSVLRRYHVGMDGRKSANPPQLTEWAQGFGKISGHGLTLTAAQGRTVRDMGICGVAYGWGRNRTFGSDHPVRRGSATDHRPQNPSSRWNKG